MPAAAPAILPLLEHPDPNVAQAAIEATGKLRIQEAVPPLCGLLQRDLWLQLAAIAALGDIGHPDAVKPLMAFVPDSILAEPAVQALRRIAAPESLEPLVPLLFSVRERSLRDPLLLAVAVVIDLHPDPEPMLRRMERDVVVDGGNLATYLGQLLEAPPCEGDADESDSLLRAAATVVAAAGIAELQPVLLARLARDAASQWIEGLFTRFPERLTGRLAELLRHPDQDVRCGALRVGSFSPGDVSAVIGHLADPHLPVRTAACHALGRVGLDATAPLLLERLRNGEPPEQAAAAHGLAGLSPEVLGELGGARFQASPRRSWWKRSACWPALPSRGWSRACSRSPSRGVPASAWRRSGPPHGYRARAPRSCSCERWPTATRRSRRKRSTCWCGAAARSR